MKLDDFTFDGMKASDYGVKMREPFNLDGASPSNSLNKKLLGRNGNLTAWDGSYANRKGTAKCFLLDNIVSTKLDTFMAGLFKNPGYRKLVVDSIPDVYLMATVTAGPETQIRNNLLAPFKITFSCKPQKFLTTGDTAISFTAAGMIVNPTVYDALPIITITGSGFGSVTVGGVTVIVHSITDQLTLDCELMDAYRQVGDGPKENKNSCIFAPIFPALKAGNNFVSWTGGITGVSIIPRWWRL